jgi:hypothetical protein
VLLFIVCKNEKHKLELKKKKKTLHCPNKIAFSNGKFSFAAQ